MKTVEEAAQEYAKSLNLKGHDSFDFETYAKQDFKAGVEFAQRWISVEDELPKASNIKSFGGFTNISPPILTRTETWYVMVNTFDVKRNKFNVKHPNLEEGYSNKITHWRHIELE